MNRTMEAVGKARLADERIACARKGGEVTPEETALDVEREWQRLSEVEMRPIRFADKPLWQADAFHLLVGRKGVGKGTLLADFVSRNTRGELAAKRNVVWVASEDSVAIDIKPRVVAAGGDAERVVDVTKWIHLPGDLDTLDRIVGEVGDVGLLIIDPVANHIAGKNSNTEEVREAIGPLNKFADTHGLILAGTRHLSEKDCSHGVLAAILGSSAWVQTPRVVLAAVRDDEDQDVTHVQVVAGNRLPPGTSGRAYRIEGVVLPGHEEAVTRARWIGDSNKDVEALLGVLGKEPSNSAVARELILTVLETEGEKESDTLDALVAEQAGVTAKTVKNQRGILSDAGLIKSRAERDEYGQVERWLVFRTNASRVREPGTSARLPTKDGSLSVNSDTKEEA